MSVEDFCAHARHVQSLNNAFSRAWARRVGRGESGNASDRPRRRNSRAIFLRNIYNGERPAASGLPLGREGVPGFDPYQRAMAELLGRLFYQDPDLRDGWKVVVLEGGAGKDGVDPRRH